MEYYHMTKNKYVRQKEIIKIINRKRMQDHIT